LIDFGRDPLIRSTLETATRTGCKFVVAPPTLTELVLGLVRGGERHFTLNRQVFLWLKGQPCAILDLPLPFVGKVLGNDALKRGPVEARHYSELIDMIADSMTFTEFMKRSNGANSAWSDIGLANSIHEHWLDQEFAALDQISRSPRAFDAAERFCRRFGLPTTPEGLEAFRQHFSAALEYFETSQTRVRGGGKPRKNDPGRYVDSQLFFYLADPKIIFVTREDFSGDIQSSPQRRRIVGVASLPLSL
jgi:hypothetical protein